MNGQAFTTESFVASGNWCFEGGGTKVKTIELDFSQGSNIIEYKPTGADAPFIDKIVLREAEPVIASAVNTEQLLAAGNGSGVTDEMQATTFGIYPNPVQAGARLTLSLPGAGPGNVFIQITDVTGRIVFTQTLPAQNNRQLKLENKLSRGMYVLLVSQGLFRTSRKLVVQ
jgi:hypothetical protein